MRSRNLLLAVFTPLLIGCRPPDCDTPSEDFVVDAVLLESDIQILLEGDSEGDILRDGIACERACAYAYRRDRGWEILSADSCDLHVDAEPGETRDAEVGSVQCDGRGVENFCL